MNREIPKDEVDDGFSDCSTMKFNNKSESVPITGR